MNSELIHAYLLINCKDGKFGSVISHLKQIDNIKEIQGICGAYDILARVESNSSSHLQKFIVQKIRMHENVQSTLTLHYTS